MRTKPMDDAPDFTPEEYAAFEVGLKDGEQFTPKPMNPYPDIGRAEAWENGYSIGVINRGHAGDGLTAHRFVSGPERDQCAECGERRSNPAHH